MDNEYDVIEMDFPGYEEEYPPFPDVTAELPFAEGKEEVYRRNRLIAAEEQAKQLAEDEKKKADRKAELENMYLEAAETNRRRRKNHGADKRSVAVITVAAVAFLAIFLVYAVNEVISVSSDHDVVKEYADIMTVYTETSVRAERGAEEKKPETEAVVTEAEAVEEVTEAAETETEVMKAAAETTAEAATEVSARQPAVPFEEEQGAVVYNTGALSFKFAASSEPIYIETEYFGDRYTVDVSVGNLTADEYMIIASNFYVPRDGKNDYILSQSGYDESTTYFSSWQRSGDSEEWTRSPIAFGFDNESSCRFTLEFTLSPGEKLSALGYDRDRGWGKAKAGDFEFMPEDFEVEME